MIKRVLLFGGCVLIGILLLMVWQTFAETPSAASAQSGNQACPLTKDEAQRAASAFHKIYAAVQSPRCVNCHGALSDLHTNPQTKHPGGYIPLDQFDHPKDPAKACVNCHDLGGSAWKLPPDNFFFTGRNDVQLCQQFKAKDNAINLLNHLAGDKLIELGFQGKKGQSDLPANPPSVSQEDFLKLAEAWVSIIYKTDDQQKWSDRFPGEYKDSCGCDANTFKPETLNVDRQLEIAVTAIKDTFTECTSKKFLECIGMQKDGYRVTGFLAREIAGYGSERTDITLGGNLSAESARRAFNIYSDSYQTPVAGRIEMFASESFEAVPGSKNSGILQVWLDPFYDGDKQAGKAFGNLVCGNLNAGFDMFLTGDEQNGQPLVARTHAQIKQVMEQVGSAMVGAGACNAEAVAALPGPAPTLVTLGKVDGGTLEVEIGRGEQGPLEIVNPEGTVLNYGDYLCFKGFGTLHMKWWDGSNLTIQAAGLQGLATQCIQIGIKQPQGKPQASTIIQGLYDFGRAIKYTVTGPPDHASQVQVNTEDFLVTVKGTTFMIGRDAAQGASIVCAEEGTVHVAPRDASVAPVDLPAGKQVQITASAIGAATAGCSIPSNAAVAQPNTNAARMTLQAAQRSLVTGDALLVPIWLVKGENLANMNFELDYDSRVLQLNGDILKGNLLDNALFTPNAKQTGRILVGFAQTGGVNGTGTLMNIPFRVIGKAGDASPLLLNVTTINNPSGGELTIDRIPGEIIVVNDDGTLPQVPGGPGGGSSGGNGNNGSGSGGTAGGVNPPGGVQLGDCDGSGALNELDALCALEMSTGIRAGRIYVDIDNSGLPITSRDAVIILQRAVGQ